MVCDASFFLLTSKVFIEQTPKIYEYFFERKQNFTRKFLCDHYYRCRSLIDVVNRPNIICFTKYSKMKVFYGRHFFYVLPECVGTNNISINGNY